MCSEEFVNLHFVLVLHGHQVAISCKTNFDTALDVQRVEPLYSVWIDVEKLDVACKRSH